MSDSNIAMALNKLVAEALGWTALEEVFTQDYHGDPGYMALCGVDPDGEENDAPNYVRCASAANELLQALRKRTWVVEIRADYFSNDVKIHTGLGVFHASAVTWMEALANATVAATSRNAAEENVG